MSTQEQQLDYIQKYLIYDIYKNFEPTAKPVSQRIECSNGLDGFMSALYTIVLEMNVSGRQKTETVLVKFMKGSKEFRHSSKSYIQFANEVFAYAEILPAYEHLLRSSKLNTNIVNDWVPRAYRAQFGIIEGLSSNDENESVVALKHLKNDGFVLGPRIFLKRDQLEAMSVVIGQYHAMGHALRVIQPQVYERLKAGVVPLPFVPERPENPGLYQALYKVAYVRFYEFFDRQRQQLLKEHDSEQDKRFAVLLERMREKHFEQPWLLLERIRTRSVDPAQADSYFSTFLHGDFNRNNILFHYAADGQTVDDFKIIDFQEMRFSTVAIDLSFYLYMNCPPNEREAWFYPLLKKYHQTMIELLDMVLQRNKDMLSEEQVQQILQDYSYERFLAHFKRYAFYGVMVCMHFMPWLMGSTEDCDKLSQLFETNMHSSEFFDLSLTIAGDECNHEIFKIVRHAFEQGYMDDILD